MQPRRRSTDIEDPSDVSHNTQNWRRHAVMKKRAGRSDKQQPRSRHRPEAAEDLLELPSPEMLPRGFLLILARVLGYRVCSLWCCFGGVYARLWTRPCARNSSSCTNILASLSSPELLSDHSGLLISLRLLPAGLQSASLRASSLFPLRASASLSLLRLIVSGAAAGAGRG